MRTMILAASVMLALAAAPAVSAEAKVTGGAASQGQMAKSKVAKKATKGTAGTTGVTGTTGGVMELTASECEALGGTVYEGGGFCNGDKYCGTTDQNGKRNRVCLEAAQ